MTRDHLHSWYEQFSPLGAPLREKPEVKPCPFAAFEAMSDAKPEARAKHTTDDGWIEWRGGECPVPRDVTIDVMLRMGTVITCVNPSFSWAHIWGDGDCVAYRVVSS